MPSDIFYLSGQINSELATEFSQFIKVAESSGVSKVRILINSTGGFIDPLYEMTSRMRLSELEFIGIVGGCARNAAFYFLQQCDSRQCFWFSDFTLHWGNITIYNGEMNMLYESNPHFQEYHRGKLELILDFLESRSNLSKVELADFAANAGDFNSTQALKFGFVDEILDIELKKKAKGKKKRK